MKRALFAAVLVGVCGGLMVGEAHGQLIPQVVQLPTFQSFSINTTVSVPDRGAMVLGGVDIDAWGDSWRGTPGLSRVPVAGRLFGNRAVGRSTGASGVSVHAHIHDLPALDDALLGQDPQRFAARDVAPRTAEGRKADFLSRNVARLPTARTSSRSPSPTPSVAEIRRELSVEQDRLEAEARDLIAQGEQAEEAGKPRMAKIFYEMAVRRTSGAARGIAQTKLAALPPPQTASR